MESASLILIVVGAAIIALVLLVRVGLRLKGPGDAASYENIAATRKEPEFDPLFAVDEHRVQTATREVEAVGKIVAEPEEAIEEVVTTASTDEPDTSVEPEAITPQVSTQTPIQRQPPRVAEDPRRVVVLNIMSGDDRSFAGEAVLNAVKDAGLEFGEWQIFHYYSPKAGDAPPLFSLTNMVKPGNFDLENMQAVTTPGLSLFMVPAGEEDDVAAFDTMLGKARQLAQELGGEVRDGRRSVLTRQAIGLIREQLNEWRHRAHAAQH